MSLFEELKRRNVFRVAVAYVIAAWLVAQVADLVLENIGAPDWVIQTLFLLLVLGLVAALIIAWAYELTPEGVKRERDVVRDDSITRVTAKKLDIITIGLLVLGIGLLAMDRFVLERPGAEVSQVSNDQSGTTDMLVGQPGQEAISPEPVRDDKSIAVLPFTTRSEQESDQFFSDGMHDDLLTQLAKISALKVISRTSVMDYRDTSKRIPEIAQELGVATILEGAVQRAGQRIRINAQLIDADSDEHLWAETFDRELTVENIFEIQSEIAVAIAEALKASLAPEERSEIGQVLTNNLEAWEAYQLAQPLVLTLSPQQISEAIDLAQKAIDLDPEFAAAYATLARGELGMFWFADPSPVRLERAWAAIQAGKAINADLPQLDTALAYYYYWGFRDYPQAIQAVERALARVPNDPDLIGARGYILRRMGRYQEHLTNLYKAQSLSPRDVVPAISIAETAIDLQDWEQATSYIKIAEGLDNGYPDAAFHRGRIAGYRDGDQEQALEHYNAAADGVFNGRGSRFYALLAMGRWQEALSVADFGEQIESYFSYSPAALNQGLVYRLMGEQQKARSLLLAALEDISGRLQVNPEGQFLMQALCMVNGALKDREATLEACAAAEKSADQDIYAKSTFWMQEIAGALALAGETDQAIEALEWLQTKEARPTSHYLRNNPFLKSLHDDPRFEPLILSFDK